MKNDLHSLSPEELGKLFPITISEYDAEWKMLFLREKKRLLRILGKSIALRIEHFGSTAVPGLASKPIIDILLEVPEEHRMSDIVITRMFSAGYDYILREDSPPAYMHFVKGYTPEGYKDQRYHVHMAPGDHTGLWNRLSFRDYLVSHPDLAKEYENLKRDLAVTYKFNREQYTSAKKEFVTRYTCRP